MAETSQEAITRMNSTLYPTKTITTSVGETKLVILSPLTLKEFLIEVQCDRLINNISKLNFAEPILASPTPGADDLGEKSSVVASLEALVDFDMCLDEDEVDMVATGDTAVGEMEMLQDMPLEGFGTSKEDAIDVDRKAALDARKKEVVHAVLLEMIDNQHGLDVVEDAEVLLDEELRVIGVDITENIMALEQRARLSSKAMVVARFRVGWQ